MRMKIPFSVGRERKPSSIGKSLHTLAAHVNGGKSNVTVGRTKVRHRSHVGAPDA
jgi:hypothetical protein